MNFFSSKSAAQRYPKGRPYFHPLVIERISARLSLSKPIDRAIDIGSGTGLSTVALREIATEVFGVDLSPEMLALAPREEHISYVLADAVKLPFADNRFDLLTLSSAFHWLERSEFLREARRILRSGGGLIVYDYYFPGKMEENAEFQRWYREIYLTRYPAPPRAGLVFTEDESGNEGLHLEGHEQFHNSVRMSVDGLVDYLMTHSNVAAAVEAGEEDIGAIRYWVEETVRPLFGGLKEGTFRFYGPIWYLRKTS